jgi:hypothetical protein
MVMVGRTENRATVSLRSWELPLPHWSDPNRQRKTRLLETKFKKY